MDQRPNIIFITSDELAYDALSTNGNPYVNTPNIDELMAQGTVFERTYCTNPACSPSRASWLTGLYGSETGIPFNDGERYDDIPDLGEHLTEAGYYTAHSGKWDIPGREAHRGFHVLYEGGRKIPAGGGELYDSCSTLEAIRFLNEYRGTKPFFLGVHYINPHDICEHLHSFEDQRKKILSLTEMGMIPESELPPLPDNFYSDSSETVLQYVCRRAPDALIHDAIRRVTQNWDEIQWRCYLYHYYRFVEKMDLEIGRLLQAIRASRFGQNTIIIFTADHGESCGKHQMFQKFTLYEESVHVPLCIASYHPSVPLRQGFRDREHLVSGIDIFPTVCKIASAELPDHVHGRSFLEPALGDTVLWRKFLYIEANCFGRAILDGRHKLITEYLPSAIRHDTTVVNHRVCRFGRNQLYDLGVDPFETVNIAEQNPDIVKEFQNYILETEGTLYQREIKNTYGKNVFYKWLSRIYEYRNEGGAE